jgi:6-phosphogluconolactonase
VGKDTLLLQNSCSSGEADPCYVAINESGFVLVFNYNGGNVGLLQLDSNGRLSELLDVKQHTGSGITDRQQGLHAHSAQFEAGSNRVISADLGTNELWFYSIDPAIRKFDSRNQFKIGMEPGAGPRHFALHPENKCIYMVNELDCTVTLVRRSEQGEYRRAASYSTLPENYYETNYSADIHLSPDGRFLYASNRGHNSIVIFRVEPSDGSLEYLGNEPAGATGPAIFPSVPTENICLLQTSEAKTSFHSGATG